MEKRYSVFISSTFKFLEKERQLAFDAILESKNFPVGMERFAAGDDTPWEFIKKELQDCDYYLLILAGRYGSIDENTGLSYTEMEYNYARGNSIPVIPLVHKDPLCFPRKATDDGEKWDKLMNFRAKVWNEHKPNPWREVSDIKHEVLNGLRWAIDNKPRPGWVREAQSLVDEKLLQKYNNLKSQVAELTKKKAIESKNSSPLAEGEDLWEVQTEWICQEPNEDLAESPSFKISWNEVWTVISPKLIAGCSHEELCRLIREFLEQTLEYEVDPDKWHAPPDCSYVIDEWSIETAIVQFNAVELMKISTGISQHVGEKVWELTAKGETLMHELRSIRKKKPR